jgi:hypothetical protein
MMIPSYHFVEIEIGDQDSRKATDRENAARPATVEIQQRSNGIGQYRMDKPIVFPVVFRTEPHFTYGSAVIAGPKPTLYHDPRGSSGVWGWQRNGRGYYTGAHCWLRVDCELIASDTVVDLSKIVVQHYLTFSAVGIKDLPIQTLLKALSSRAVGL